MQLYIQNVDRFKNLPSWSLGAMISYWLQLVFSHPFLFTNCQGYPPSFKGECSSLKENEEKLRNQIAELSLRERVLMRRLAAKEQDMQEYAGQLSEMKVPGGGVLKSALLDPAVNLLLQRLRQELSETRTRLDDTQNELSAWKFTPDSNTGKRLMAKCRLLYQENEELGAMISKGRLAKLEGDLALQKSFSEEVKKSQSELDELLQDLDEDVEGMQSTIYYLQQELKKAKDTIAQLEQDNTNLKSSSGGGGGRQQHLDENERLSSHQQPVIMTTSTLNGVAAHTKWAEEGDGESDSLDSAQEGDNGSAGGGDTPPRTKDIQLDGECVVNNNVDGQRKRTSSENSDDNSSVIKKPRSDNQLLPHHYSDEQVITNGGNGGQ
ncbi:pre-mRNA-splicing regulator female-lethal(2)D-like isoform X2 [Rhodnius prolixus]|uniref:pre-mRNA-splicing regulator female-lethal(2)D-like isoform X2 n=1 Tax=Rhodnius prolixus TaxID=13249 RepID=UPI003D18A316